jgi:hypothetical protein
VVAACRRNQGDPCVEDCEWEKKDCDNQCRKIPEKKCRASLSSVIHKAGRFDLLHLAFR